MANYIWKMFCFISNTKADSNEIYSKMQKSMEKMKRYELKLTQQHQITYSFENVLLRHETILEYWYEISAMTSAIHLGNIKCYCRQQMIRNKVCLLWLDASGNKTGLVSYFWI